MKLIKSKNRPAMLGLSASRREWWDLGEGYEIYVSVSKNSCGLNVSHPPSHKCITLETAKYLGIDTSIKHMSFKSKGRELYLSPSIDCVMLNYTKPEKYQELLKRHRQLIFSKIELNLTMR